MSVRSFISRTTRPSFINFSVHVVCVAVVAGTPLMTVQYVMYSGFVNEVTYFHSVANWAEAVRQRYVWSSSTGGALVSGRAARTGAKSSILDCLEL